MEQHPQPVIESIDTQLCEDCDPFTSIRILDRLREEGWEIVDRHELKKLRIAVDAVLLAIRDKGSHPEYHDGIRRRHEKEWPMLWRAIAALTEARRG